MTLETTLANPFETALANHLDMLSRYASSTPFRVRVMEKRQSPTETLPAREIFTGSFENAVAPLQALVAKRVAQGFVLRLRCGKALCANEALIVSGSTLRGHRVEVVVEIAQPAMPMPNTQSQPTLPLEPPIPNGTYTVCFNHSGREYRTLRVELAKTGGLAGKTILSYLSGPDNSRDFQSFAFLDGRKLVIWKRFRDNPAFMTEMAEAARTLCADHMRCGEAYAMRSGRCFRCGKKLTVPASLHRGLGPDCAAALGAG